MEQRTPKRQQQQQNRDESGRYDYDGGMDRMCVCGCTLGVHAASAPHECIAYSLPPDYKECQCPKFRQSRKQPCKRQRG